ncbi:MAG: hypothetical protein ACLGSA_04750 [Acidobacteriota bacterium]
MNFAKRSIFPFSSLAMPLALAAVLLTGGLSSDALAFKRQSTVTGSGGKTATHEVNANRTSTGYERSSTTTGPNGNTTSTESSGNFDKATNTWTKNKTVTGPGGKSKSWQKSTTITK